MSEKLVLKTDVIEYVNVGTGTLHIHRQMHSACMCGYFLHSSAEVHPSRKTALDKLCKTCRNQAWQRGWLAIESEVEAG